LRGSDALSFTQLRTVNAQNRDAPLQEQDDPASVCARPHQGQKRRGW